MYVYIYLCVCVCRYRYRYRYVYIYTHLALLLGVLVLEEFVDVRDHVEGQRVREDAVRRLAAVGHRFAALESRQR